jgi:hypothetical protein
VWTTTNPLHPAEIAYHRDRLATSWSGRPMWRRTRRTRPDVTARTAGCTTCVAVAG